MRIGIDAHVLGKGKGGVERYVQYLVDLLPQHAPQYEFFVFVDKTMAAALNETAPDNVTYVAMLSNNPMIGRSLLLPLMALKYQLDVLQVQRIAPWLLGKCKILLTVHDLTPIKYAERYKGFTNTLVRLLTRGSVERAAMVITPTDAIGAEVKQYYPHINAPVRTFYNGVDLEQFHQAKAEQGHSSCLAEMGIKSPYLFFSGALEARKNLEVIYHALADERVDSNLSLVVAGGVRDDEYRDALWALALQLGIDNRVHLPGFVTNEQLTTLYQNASIFVAPSWDEGFNIPPLEAMACGVPVVCSSIPVHRELFGKAALLFSPDSAQQLAEHIAEISSSPQLVSDLQQQAQSHCVERFTWPAMAERMAGFLAELA